MSTGDVTLLRGLNGSRCQRLYYYRGNFYHPMDLQGAEIGRVRGAIRKFMKANKALIDADRADPGYKTLLTLFDEQDASHGEPQ